LTFQNSLGYVFVCNSLESIGSSQNLRLFIGLLLVAGVDAGGQEAPSLVTLACRIFCTSVSEATA